MVEKHWKKDHLKMKYHKQTERVWIESSLFWIVDVMCFCPFFDLHKAREDNYIEALLAKRVDKFGNTKLIEHTSKTISWKRPSISLSHNKILDLIWPTRLSMEISQEMLCWICSIFKIGTLAWGISCSLHHPPEKRNFME